MGTGDLVTKDVEKPRYSMPSLVWILLFKTCLQESQVPDMPRKVWSKEDV